MSAETSHRAVTAYSEATSISTDRWAINLTHEYAAPSGSPANAGVGRPPWLSPSATTSALGLAGSETTRRSKVVVCVAERFSASGFATTHTTTTGGVRIGGGVFGEAATWRRGAAATGRRDGGGGADGRMEVEAERMGRTEDAALSRARSHAPITVTITRTAPTPHLVTCAIAFMPPCLAATRAQFASLFSSSCSA